MKANIYVKTFGCSLNRSDSERIKGILKADSFNIVNDVTESDIVIINSCTVKNVAEQKLYREIRNSEKLGKKIIVAGCVPQAEKKLAQTTLKKYSIIGPNNINDIVKVVNATLENKRIVLLDDKHPINKINNSTLPENKLIAIIPISEGCIGNCSYCKTKQARGNINSYTPEKIIKKIEESLKSGAKEIWLTAQDTSCYGIDIETSLPQLLEKIIKIKYDFKIRVGMGNPNSFLKEIDNYLEIFENDKENKLYKFFHIPVQSGSNKILKDMNRFYDVEDFKKLIKIIKTRLPDACIATDIIVGYPKESDKDFKESLDLITWLKADILNVSRFWIRPQTEVESKGYKHLPTLLIKERTKEMTDLFKEISKQENDKWKTWQGQVLISEKGKNNSLVGKNDSYKQVVFHCEEVLKNKLKLGDKVIAKTQSLDRYHINGEVC